MKRLLLLISLPAIAALSCNKVQERQMIVVRDCTGTYLRLNQKDYQVCNTSATDMFAAGTLVKASFKSIEGCSQAPQFVCELYHPSDGWIKIVHIEE